jgi:2'-5' RNA ligase
MAQKRLFIGLGFSSDLIKDLEPWVKKIRKTADHKETSLRWIPPENYHVTLVFLGNTPEEEIPEIERKMREVADRHTPFSLKIREFGAFPTLNQARVIYLGVQRSQAILNLQGDLETAFEKTEDREYSPHLTVARLRNPKSCRDLLSPFQKVDLGKQEVREIILFNSVMAGSFPVYKRIHTVDLNPVVPLNGN